MARDTFDIACYLMVQQGAWYAFGGDIVKAIDEGIHGPETTEEGLPMNLPRGATPADFGVGRA